MVDAESGEAVLCGLGVGGLQSIFWAHFVQNKVDLLLLRRFFTTTKRTGEKGGQVASRGKRILAPRTMFGLFFVQIIWFCLWVSTNTGSGKSRRENALNLKQAGSQNVPQFSTRDFGAAFFTSGERGFA